jgi:hypothetical protein
MSPVPQLILLANHKQEKILLLAVWQITLISSVGRFFEAVLVLFWQSDSLYMYITGGSRIEPANIIFLVRTTRIQPENIIFLVCTTRIQPANNIFVLPAPRADPEKKFKNQRTWKKPGKNHQFFLENCWFFEGFEISGTDWYFDSDS